MRVGFNARLLASPDMRGWNRYTVNLLAELGAQGIEMVLYSDRPLHEGYVERFGTASFKSRVSPRMPYIWWEQHWLPAQCTADRVAILHSPFNFGLPWSSPCPRVLTLHDAIDRVYYQPRRTWKERLSRNHLETEMYHWIARTRAHRIITVSDYAKHELVRYLHIPGEKISVTYEGADPSFHRPVPAPQKLAIRQKYGFLRPYFFYLGGWEQRKNIPFLLRAFALASLAGADLALAGGKQDEQRSMSQAVRDLGIADQVKLLGWVTDADAPALYADALAFVYPSEHEGFGLQLCEAMATGCPVLASRATSLPEVLGSGGETFALDDPAELTALLRRVAGEPDYRSELIRRAQARSGELSWRRTAEQTIAVYERALRC